MSAERGLGQEAVLVKLTVEIAFADAEHFGGVSAVAMAGFER